MKKSRVAVVDIGQVLDDGPFGKLQKLVVLMAALAIVMYGFDGQLIGFAIPLMIKEWHIGKAEFSPALAAGLIGMGFGTMVASVVADRDWPSENTSRMCFDLWADDCRHRARAEHFRGHIALLFSWFRSPGRLPLLPP
jgi:MFS family permease